MIVGHLDSLTAAARSGCAPVAMAPPGNRAGGFASAWLDGTEPDEATAALVFAHALPGGVEPSPDESRSYAQWLWQRTTADSDADA